ncbi:MAG: hypothetical protein ACOYME_10445 [Prochlorotrichaceae cyanobacterium]|jgi:hypothetical protein
MTNFNRASHERLFNLDSLERNNWRTRINQLKRELREGEETQRKEPIESTGFRPSPRRRPAHPPKR